MPNFKGQMSNQIQNPNVKLEVWALSFELDLSLGFCHLDF